MMALGPAPQMPKVKVQELPLPKVKVPELPLPKIGGYIKSTWKQLGAVFVESQVKRTEGSKV